MLKLGRLQRRFSYATWTAPSHYNLLIGLLPHPSPNRIFASTHYKRDLARYSQRLGVSGIGFIDMLPQLWLPDYLRHTLGYTTHARVSLPVLNPATPINTGFDTFELLDRHNDLEAALGHLRFSPDRPSFWLINTGETHYPYATAEEPESEWPRLHGVHGVFRELSHGRPLHRSQAPAFFEQRKLDRLHARQIRAVSAIDDIVAQLYERVPPTPGSPSPPITGSCSVKMATSATDRSTTRRSSRSPWSKVSAAERSLANIDGGEFVAPAAGNDLPDLDGRTGLTRHRIVVDLPR